jgi:hypothetical protein
MVASFFMRFKQPVKLRDGLRIVSRELVRDHDHVIDRDKLVLRVPGARLGVRIGKDRLERFIVWHRRPVDRGIELAFEQHLRHVIRRADHARRIPRFGNVAVFKREPLHLAEIDAVVVGQNAAQPGGGGLIPGTHANALAGKIMRRQRAARGVVKHSAVLETGQHRRRQKPQAFVVFFRLEKSGERHLAGVISMLTHHRLEGVVHRLHLDEIEGQPIGFDLAALERQRVRVIADRNANGCHAFLTPALHAIGARAL